MQLGRLLTFRRCLTSTILLLAGLVQALMTVVLAGSIEKQSAAERIVARMPIAEALTRAVDGFGAEGSLALVAAHAAGLAPEELADAMSGARARSDGDLARGLAQLEALTAPHASPHASPLPLQSLAQELSRVRQSFDGALHGSGVTAEQRRAAVARLVAELDRMVGGLRDTQARLLELDQDIEPSASQIQLRMILLDGLVAAWQRHGLRGAIAAGGALSDQGAGPALLLAFGDATGRLMQSRAAAKRLAAASEDDALAAALKALPEAAALSGPRPAAVGGLAAADGPVDPEIEQGRRILEISGTALAAAAREEAETAGGAIMLGLSLFAIAIATGATALALVHFRLVRPLRRLTRTLEAVARGQAARPVPGQLRGGELGALARAVECLRQAADDSPGIAPATGPDPAAAAA